MAVLYIDKPGNHTLSEDITCSTLRKDDFLISISSDDVILDGNMHTINQINPLIPHVIGIQVAPNVKNITIYNLTLKNLSGGGIWVQGNNSNITAKNVKIINC